MNDQLKIVNAFLEVNRKGGIKTDQHEFRSEPSGLALVLAFSLIFFLIDLSWYVGWGTKKANVESATQVKVPLVFQSGGSTTARIEVPVTVNVESVSLPVKANDIQKEEKIDGK
jgi:hypothetical protein